MWSATSPVGVDMDQTFSVDDRLPKIVVAVAAGIGAVYAPNFWLRGLLAGVAATASAIVFLGSSEARNATDSQEEPHWRTLKTYRVEA
jgi:hypothetical protein